MARPRYGEEVLSRMLTLTKLDTFIQELLDLPIDRHSKSPEATKVVRAIFRVIVDALIRGEKVAIRGLGRFTPIKYKAHNRPKGSVFIAERHPDGTFKRSVYSKEDTTPTSYTKVIFTPSGSITAALNIDNPASLTRNARRFVEEVPDAQAD